MVFVTSVIVVVIVTLSMEELAEGADAILAGAADGPALAVGPVGAAGAAGLIVLPLNIVRTEMSLLGTLKVPPLTEMPFPSMPYLPKRQFPPVAVASAIPSFPVVCLILVEVELFLAVEMPMVHRAPCMCYSRALQNGPVALIITQLLAL